MKEGLGEWMRLNRKALVGHELRGTGTTGRVIEEQLGISTKKLKSGPFGGDQQVGARIAEGQIDFLLFFWDPLNPLPPYPDVRALLRVTAAWNIFVASNRASADFMTCFPLMSSGYERVVPDYAQYRDRLV
jgi:methylglyoxal synthase